MPPTPPLLFAEGGAMAMDGQPRAVGLLAAARDAFSGHPDTAGDRHMATMMWAMALAFMGSPDAAEAAARDYYLHEAQQTGAAWAESWTWWVAALAARRRGRLDEASRRCQQALLLQRGIGDLWGLTWSLLLYATILTDGMDLGTPDTHRAERAAWLLAAAEQRRHTIGVRIDGLQSLSALRRQAMTRLTEILDPRTLQRQLDAGRRHHDYAVDYAIDDRPPRASRQRGALTRRQSQIAELILAGRSNQEIADALFISRRTAEWHIAQLLAKLGVKRRQLTRDLLTAATNGTTRQYPPRQRRAGSA